MYILAGAAAVAGILAFSPTMRRKAGAVGAIAAWYGMRVYTEVDLLIERAAAKWKTAVGDPENESKPESLVEMVAIGDAYVPVHTRMFYNDKNEPQIMVGSSSPLIESERRPCRHGIYGPTIRLTEKDGTVRTFPVELDGNYCLVDNVLFDPPFVGYWLQTRYNLVLEPGDTWETTFLGPGMAPMSISHKQKGVCTPEGISVRELKRYREEPAEGEPWLLDLSGVPSH